MTIDWIKGFLIPLIEIVFVGGIAVFIIYIIGKAIHNAWSKSFRFFLKFKVFRRSYPEKTVKWIMDCIDNGLGYYDAKKLLMVNMIDPKQINETLWIYDEVIKKMGNKRIKNGGKINEKDLPTM